jgi:hypothetical protein
MLLKVHVSAMKLNKVGNWMYTSKIQSIEDNTTEGPEVESR